MNCTRQPDKTWINWRNKYEGLFQDLTLPPKHRHLIVAYFKKTFQHTQQQFEQKGLPYHLLEPYTLLHDTEPDTVVLLMADQLENQNFLAAVRKLNAPVIVHFVEHYPKWSVEKNCLDALEKLPVSSIVQFYNSLDEPLFQKFGGHRLIELVGRFGMEENECISHRMIDQSIRKAQKNLTITRCQKYARLRLKNG